MRRSPAVAPVALIAFLSTAQSPDGKWMSYAYQPNDGNATLFIKQVDGDKVFSIPIGSTPAAVAAMEERVAAECSSPTIRGSSVTT